MMFLFIYVPSSANPSCGGVPRGKAEKLLVSCCMMRFFAGGRANLLKIGG